jgi:hypothetical protein
VAKFKPLERCTVKLFLCTPERPRGMVLELHSFLTSTLNAVNRQLRERSRYPQAMTSGTHYVQGKLDGATQTVWALWRSNKALFHMNKIGK